MLIAVAHAASIQQQRMIEQRTVTVFRRLQLLDETLAHLQLIGIHFRELRGLRRIPPVRFMGESVMRIGDADLRERNLCNVARHHEAEDAGDVGLKSGRHRSNNTATCSS